MRWSCSRHTGGDREKQQQHKVAGYVLKSGDFELLPREEEVTHYCNFNHTQNIDGEHIWLHEIILSCLGYWPLY